ncbi:MULTISPECIES: hypothetical protein [Kitasatospora]|uniref:Uncharacterized protein n=1 Tax=Kitasatospora cathayae TaxID=3004092 RepID=A0ABY7QCF5_9ACTN|nr:hypothetical protein [Kitasatospora sp. HUAS 3-15]WBP90370.1 hypothetical protein O1G21_33945 [Kitasatospora sp. HUAS 3-15]
MYAQVLTVTVRGADRRRRRCDEHGEALDAAGRHGFEVIGPLRV